MTPHWFDALSQDMLARPRPRRSVVTWLAGALLALVTSETGDTLAKETRRKKSKKKPLKRNEYGCVPIGKPCRGNDAVCCSGICEGTKPSKGERDRSQCIAHDTGGCVRGQQSDFCHMGSVITLCKSSAGHPGSCETTTGNAGFCLSTIGGCSDCRTDRECQATMDNPLAACLRCADFCPQGTACVAP